MSTSLNSSAIKAFIVLDSNRNIDFEASAANYLQKLQAFESLLQANDEDIAIATGAVFDKYKGVNVTKLESFVMREMNVSPETFGEAQKRVLDYIKSNTGEVGEALYGMRKGKGGGHWRWADKAETSKEVTESRKEIAERTKA